MTNKRNKDLLTIERLKEVAHYDPGTGSWTRLKAVRGTRVGPIAGCLLPCGHRVITIDGQTHRSSHLAFFYVTGCWPAAEIDHRNCDPADDAWVNLREANSSQNKCNRRVSTRSASGLKGAYRYGNRWRSQVGRRGEVRHLGVFDTAEEAHEAFVAATTKLFGEFARAA